MPGPTPRSRVIANNDDEFVLSPQVGFVIGADGQMTRYVDPPVFENFSIEGGGPLAEGAYREIWTVLEEVREKALAAGRRCPVNIKRVVGSSAGAMMAIFIAVGSTGKQLEDMSDASDLSQFKDVDRRWLKNVIRNNPSLRGDRLAEKILEAAEAPKVQSSGFARFKHQVSNLVKGGLYKGEVLLNFLRAKIHDQIKEKLTKYLNTLSPKDKSQFMKFLLENKIVEYVKGNTIQLSQKISFRHLHLLKEYSDKHKANFGFKDLYITGSNLTRKQLEIFSYENEKYCDMEIALAGRISMGIPRFYQPVKFDGCLWADGGLYKNNPVDIFNKKPTNKVPGKKNKTTTAGMSQLYKPKGADQYTGVYGQNLATLAVTLDTPEEMHDFWYKKKKNGFFARWIIDPIVTFLKTRFAKGVNFVKNLRKEFDVTKEQHAQQMIKIPVYDTRVDDPTLDATTRRKIEAENKKFNLFNFELTKEEQALLSRNGRQAAERYFEVHRGEKLDLKVFKAHANLDPNVQAMSVLQLRELHDFLIKTPADRIYRNHPDYTLAELEQKRKAFIAVVKHEAQDRLVVAHKKSKRPASKKPFVQERIIQRRLVPAAPSYRKPSAEHYGHHWLEDKNQHDNPYRRASGWKQKVKRNIEPASLQKRPGLYSHHRRAVHIDSKRH